jgi:hypothetical protein
MSFFTDLAELLYIIVSRLCKFSSTIASLRIIYGGFGLYHLP